VDVVWAMVRTADAGMLNVSENPGPCGFNLGDFAGHFPRPGPVLDPLRPVIQRVVNTAPLLS